MAWCRRRQQMQLIDGLNGAIIDPATAIGIRPEERSILGIRGQSRYRNLGIRAGPIPRHPSETRTAGSIHCEPVIAAVVHHKQVPLVCTVGSVQREPSINMQGCRVIWKRVGRHSHSKIPGRRQVQTTDIRNPRVRSVNRQFRLRITIKSIRRIARIIHNHSVFGEINGKPVPCA